jgi:hypothetical protein
MNGHVGKRVFSQAHHGDDEDVHADGEQDEAGVEADEWSVPIEAVSYKTFLRTSERVRPA